MASCSGSPPSRLVTIGSGTWTPIGSSRRARAGAQRVQAQPRDDGREPAAEIGDIARVGPAETEPRLLDRVVGLADRAEHPVGHRPQVRSVDFEALGQGVGLVHSVTSSAHVPSTG